MPSSCRTRLHPGRNTRTLRARLASAEQALAAERRELAALHRITAIAQSGQSFAASLEAALQEVARVTGIAHVTVELYDATQQRAELDAIGQDGLAPCSSSLIMLLDPAPAEKATDGPKQGASGAGGRSLLAPVERAGNGREPGVDESAVCLPLTSMGRLIGALILAEPGGCPLDAVGVAVAGRLAAHIAALVARRQAEECRAVLKQQFHAILDNFAAAVLLVDAAGGVRYINQRAAALFGRRPTDVVGCALAELLTPAVARPLLERNRQVLDEHACAEQEATLDLPGGRRTYLIADQAIADPLGPGELLLISAIDITTHAQTRAELQVALAKYRTLFDAFPLGITVSNASGMIVETNAMAEHLLGLARQEHSRRRIDSAEWRIVRPDGSPMPVEEYASVRALIERRPVENVEMGVITPSGQTTWINVTAAPLPLEDYGVVITYGDVTARKQAEDALLQLNTTLEQRVAERTAELKAANERLQVEIGVRHQVEQALRESEARFRRLADNAPDIIYRFDYLPEPHFSYVSPAALEIVGYRPEDHYADPNLGVRIVHHDDLPRLQMIMNSPETMREAFELRWMHSNGSTIWVEQRNVPIFDGAGRVVAIEGIARDITERKRTSEALRQSELQYRTLVESMTQGMIVYQDGRVVFGNEAAARIVGCTLAELINCSAEDINGRIHGEDRERVAAFMDRLMDGLPIVPEPFRIYRFADNAVRWVNVASTYTVYGNRPAFLSVFSDVTELKEIEERLRVSEARLQLLLAKTPAVIFSGRAEGDFGTTFISESLRNVLGYAPTQFLEDHSFWISQIHPEDRATIFTDVAMLRHAGWRQYEYRFRHNDGTYRWLENGVSLLPSVDGQPAEVIGYMVDITERKQAEEILRQANLDLAQASRMKDAFLANMSHELRTPLNAILGRAELLQEEVQGPLTDRQLRSVVSIEESGRHLLDLITDILDLAKVEANGIDLQDEPVDVQALCEGSLQFITATAAKKRLVLSSHIDPQVVQIRGDTRRLKQILVNLLANAVKFTPEGGCVTLDLHGDTNAGKAHFIVADTGIGIAAADLPRLFQPFVQLNSSLSRQYEGTGLGLALVERLVRLHGGDVTVESAPGRGSRFSVTLPWEPPVSSQLPTAAAAQQPADDAPSSADEGPAGEPARDYGQLILLAEDNPETASLVAEYLRAHGYTVALAADGYEALAQAQKLHPDLILLDIQMPRTNGFEALRWLRSSGGLEATPIIALTALAMPGDRERCLAAGANDYLSKPVSLRLLLASIQDLLTQPSASS